MTMFRLIKEKKKITCYGKKNNYVCCFEKEEIKERKIFCKQIKGIQKKLLQTHAFSEPLGLWPI